MSYVPRLEMATAPAAAVDHTPAADRERRIRGAIGTCQALLVIRIVSVLLAIGLLPPVLPSIFVRLDAAHVAVLPVSGLNRDAILLVVAALSAVELYLVYRLADRWRIARFGVLFVESFAIVITAGALALGSGFAALPLTTSVVATCLLLLNQVRWAFRLQPRRDLTGHRRGGVFAGYAPAPLDAPKAAQAVGYTVPQRPRS
jgi:uncharacterized protein YqgC (DUF456 family)